MSSIHSYCEGSAQIKIRELRDQSVDGVQYLEMRLSGGLYFTSNRESVVNLETTSVLQ
jgi:hypothetical protein